jgi:hypothetical protein
LAPAESLEALRAEALALHRENVALAILAQATDKSEYERSQRFEETLPQASREMLEKQISGCREAVARIREYLGCAAPRDALLKLVDDCRRAREGQILYVSKENILKLCSHYDRILPGWETLPLHAQIAMELGQYRDKVGPVEFRITEAIAVEDMCALHNEAERLSRSIDPLRGTAADRKRAKATFRAAVIAAHNALEAYMNGLAWDHIARNREHLPPDVVDELSDWDSQRDRPKYLSLRDKVNRYQRHIIGRPHAEVQEGNCPALRFVLEGGKAVRDAVIHPSPRSEAREVEPGRGEFVADLDFADVLTMTRSTIEVIERVESAVNGSTARVRDWLPPLGADHRFPPTAFE